MRGDGQRPVEGNSTVPSGDAGKGRLFRQSLAKTRKNEKEVIRHITLCDTDKLLVELEHEFQVRSRFRTVRP